MTKDGQLLIDVSGKVYEYWIDGALLERVKFLFDRQPWKGLLFVKKNCREWERREDLE